MFLVLWPAVTPHFGLGMVVRVGREREGERDGGGRPRANCVWGVYPLTCFYWQRLQWWNVSNIKAKYSLHHVQPLHPPSSTLLPSLSAPLTGALLHSSALTVLGYSFWCCCCCCCRCCCLACLVSGLVCLHSEANPSTQLNPAANATSPRLERGWGGVDESKLGAALSPLTCGHYKNQWINIYMQKYLTTKKKQMYNGPPLLNAYLSRGVSTEEGRRGSCQGPGASPVCTNTLDYWYVFQYSSSPPISFSDPLQICFLCEWFFPSFFLRFFPFSLIPFSSHCLTLKYYVSYINGHPSVPGGGRRGGNTYKGLCKIISITNLIILNSLPQPPIDSFHCLSIGF